MRNIEYDDAVFINCPFDEAYTPMMVAVIYAVYGSGFFPRSALEEDNGLQNRLDKIQKIIENCRYGIHDICRVELNENKLPRFNMPFELGLFFGAKRFGDTKQQLKNAVIFDTEAHRYGEYISDIKGVDIKAHGNNPLIAVEKICNWLKTASRRRTNQEYKKILDGYAHWKKNFDNILKKGELNSSSLTFNDYCLIVEEAINGQLTG